MFSRVTALAPAGVVAAPAGVLAIGPPSGVDAVVEAQAVARIGQDHTPIP